MQEPAGRKRDIHVERGGKPSRSARWARSASDEAAYHAINRFAASAARHLYLRFALSHLMQSGAGIFDAETYISTQPAQALEEARVPDSHEDEKRGRSAVAPPGQGTQARLGETGFPRVVFPRTSVASRQMPVARRSGGSLLVSGNCGSFRMVSW